MVDLCLQAAVKCDPQGLALHFYRNGEPHGDVQGEEAFLARYAPPSQKKKKTNKQTFVTTHNTLINWGVLSPRQHSKAHFSSQICQIRLYHVYQRLFCVR